MSKILQESMRRYMQLKLNLWKALEKYQSEYHAYTHTSTCATQSCATLAHQLLGMISKEQRGVL